jgi:hypothetical protein
MPRLSGESPPGHAGPMPCIGRGPGQLPPDRLRVIRRPRATPLTGAAAPTVDHGVVLRTDCLVMACHWVPRQDRSSSGWASGQDLIEDFRSGRCDPIDVSGIQPVPAFGSIRSGAWKRQRVVHQEPSKKSNNNNVIMFAAGSRGNKPRPDPVKLSDFQGCRPVAGRGRLIRRPRCNSHGRRRTRVLNGRPDRNDECSRLCQVSGPAQGTLTPERRNGFGLLTPNSKIPLGDRNTIQCTYRASERLPNRVDVSNTNRFNHGACEPGHRP